MRPWQKTLLITLAVLAIALTYPAYWIYEEGQKAFSEDPLVWQQDIRQLTDRADQKRLENQAVVFVGSSSIRMWDSLEQDMAPIPVLQMGFGGAKLGDVLHYSEQLVSNYRPKAVVVFAGTNDIHPGASKSPEQLVEAFQQLVRQLRDQQAELPIYYIAITPSPLRWEVWPIAQRTNELIAEYAETDARIRLIDTSPALLGSDGRPDKTNYIFDNLHLNSQGYAHWARIIKHRLQSDGF